MQKAFNREDRKGSAKFAKKDFARISSKMGFSLRSSRPFFASFAAKGSSRHPLRSSLPL